MQIAAVEVTSSREFAPVSNNNSAWIAALNQPGGTKALKRSVHVHWCKTGRVRELLLRHGQLVIGLFT